MWYHIIKNEIPHKTSTANDLIVFTKPKQGVSQVPTYNGIPSSPYSTYFLFFSVLI